MFVDLFSILYFPLVPRGVQGGTAVLRALPAAAHAPTPAAAKTIGPACAAAEALPPAAPAASRRAPLAFAC